MKILIGDNELVARHICGQAGIAIEQVVLGHELEKMSDLALMRVVEQTSVFARVSPAQKHRIILMLKQQGHIVGYLGDGLNDAPALQSTDVGISVHSAVEIAKEAASLILLEQSLQVIHQGILEGRRAFGNVLKGILMETSSNFGNVFSMDAAFSPHAASPDPAQ